MKKLKRTLRLIGLVFLLALSSIGVGILGGVPIQPIRKKEDTIEVVIEMNDSLKDDHESTDESLFKQ